MFRISTSRLVKSFLRKRGLVLMYHRIATVRADPWDLAVSPGNFEQQLKVLAEEYRVLPATTIAQHIRTQSVQSKTIGITFDDGYQDNYFVAKPLLEKYRHPATFFIPNHFIGKEQPFWWDELTDLLLEQAQLPAKLRLQTSEGEFSYALGEDAKIDAHKQELHSRWKARQVAPTRRCDLYLKLWQLMKPLSLPEIAELMQQLKTWADYHSKNFELLDLPINSSQLMSLANDFEIGGHTVSHTALGFQPVAVQREEIQTNRNYLQQVVNRPVCSISYPHGSFNDSTIEIARASDLTVAFTTKNRVFTSKSDPYRVGRFCVKNWDSKQFREKLENWLAYAKD